MTRDDLVRLGQGGRPWDFLPVAIQALRQVPGDIGLRLITTSNLVRLGLRTAAADHLALVPEAILNSPEVQGLVRVVRDLAPDAIDTAERTTLCRANLEALGGENPISKSDFERWSAGASAMLFCRATDGNIISRPADGGHADWRTVTDQRQALARLVRQHFAPTRPDHTRPVYIEGIDPPWLFPLLFEARPREGTGYLPPITILQADTEQFLDGLSQADLRSALSAGNVTVLVGPDASERLAKRLDDRVIYQLAGPCLTTIATRARCSPPVVEVLARSSQRQEVVLKELRARVDAAYPPRSSDSWRARFDDALRGGEPLRILIPTTRYSTFIQHASRDLARALESRGHRSRVLIEPDDSTKFVTFAYLDACLDFRPDLMVTINYPRASISEAVPAHIPFVCWVQDAMPHLFNPEIGAAQGPLDFLVGHLFEELFDRHGYPPERAMSAAIVADETKFHIGPIAAPTRARFECEVAYVSHQSESPEVQHARLCDEFAALAIGRTLDRLQPLLRHEAFKPLGELKTIDAHDLALRALRDELGREPDASLVDVVTRSYCQPYIDRLIRHQTLEWAAAIADRRGWRLKLYGKGWDSHPRLGRFAAGPLDHGDDLRVSYNAAAVHLHMMAHALVHQRLIECVLSGGFPICRLHAPERWSIVECLSRLGVRQGAPPLKVDDPTFPPRASTASWADAPALMQLASAMQRLGLFDDVFPPYAGARRGPVINDQEWTNTSLPPHDQELWSAFFLLGQSEQFMFHSPQTLEARIEFAVSRPDLRDILSGAARKRMLDRFTYTGFAGRLLACVRDSLGPGRTAHQPHGDHRA